MCSCSIIISNHIINHINIEPHHIISYHIVFISSYITVHYIPTRPYHIISYHIIITSGSMIMIIHIFHKPNPAHWGASVSMILLACFYFCTAGLAFDFCRNRIYIVGYRLDGFVTNKPPEDFFEEIGYLLEAMKTPTLPVQSLLLADDDPDLQAETSPERGFPKGCGEEGRNSWHKGLMVSD